MVSPPSAGNSSTSSSVISSSDVWYLTSGSRWRVREAAAAEAEPDETEAEERPLRWDRCAKEAEQGKDMSIKQGHEIGALTTDVTVRLQLTD